MRDHIVAIRLDRGCDLRGIAATVVIWWYHREFSAE